MNALTLFGACAVTVMLLAYTLERRAVGWVFVFALACAASSLYGWLAGTWPFGVVEGVWALVALRRGVMRVQHEQHEQHEQREQLTASSRVRAAHHARGAMATMTEKQARGTIARRRGHQRRSDRRGAHYQVRP